MIKLARGKKYVNEVATKQTIFKHNKNISNAFHNYGAEITRDLKKVIETGPRSGRVYFIRGFAHQASASGEPPASLSGRLANSFGYKARQYELLVFSDAVSPGGFNYPKYLEEELNRPYWEVTHKASAYKLQKELQDYDI